MSYFTYRNLIVGQSLLTVRHTVSNDMIRQYAEATGDTHPWHKSGAPPSGDLLAPPAMSTIFSTAVLGQSGVTRLPGDIHTKQEYANLAPIRAGAVITTKGTLVSKYEKRGRKYIVFETTSTDETGVEVARCKVTLAVPE